MSANKIAETSTSTGTGDITLAGAWSVPSSFITGNRTFNSFYGLNHRFPYMIQDQQGNWEKGIGYLSNATNLVRETVIDNSLSTTALINFPTGDKLVMVPTDPGSDTIYKLRPSVGYAGGAFVFNNGSSLSLVADRVFLTPLLLKRPMAASGVYLTVTTGVASSKIRIGIYQISVADVTGFTFSRLIDFGESPSTTTVNISLSGNVKLAAGLYFTAVVSNLNPSIRGQTIGVDTGIAGNANIVPCQGFQKNAIGAVDALPATISCTTSDLIQNTAVPRPFILGDFL